MTGRRNAISERVKARKAAMLYERCARDSSLRRRA